MKMKCRLTDTYKICNKNNEPSTADTITHNIRVLNEYILVKSTCEHTKAG
jgi:hypothetical protein